MKRLVLTLVVVFILSLPQATAVDIQSPDINLSAIDRFATLSNTSSHPWPMYLHDANHTGRSEANTSGNNGDELWQFPNDLSGTSQPVIDRNGTIYYGGIKLYAIYPNGTKKWEFKVNNDVIDNPTIGPDGTIYCDTGKGGSLKPKLFALYPNGTEKWELDLYSNISPATIAISLNTSICANESKYTIYLGSGTKLVAVRLNGTIKWEFDVGNLAGTPSVDAKGNVYISQSGALNYLYALYPNGTVKWKFYGIVEDCCVIGADGIIYAWAYSGKLFAIYPNGTKKWEYSRVGGAYVSPAIGPDGTIYLVGGVAVGTANLLCAIYPNGTEKWEYMASSDIISAPTVSMEGTIYFCTYGHKLYAIYQNGTKKWIFLTDGENAFPPAIGADGTVYVESGINTLYAIGTKKVPEFEIVLIILPAVALIAIFIAVRRTGRKDK